MTRAEISHAVGAISPRHIRDAEEYFDEKTYHISIRKIALIAAIVIIVLSLCAFTYSYFSTLNGDNLILTATYAGDGIVHAHVENQSDRDLKLEPVVKLLYYSDKDPVATTGQPPVITGLTIPANAKQTVRIDLRNAYDLYELEHTYNDFILLQLTNKGFAPGQKWTCIVSFRKESSEYIPQYVKTGDTVRAEGVLSSLKAYFENFTPDVFARWADVPDYLELVEAELAQVDGNIVVPIDPLLLIDCSDYPNHSWSSCFDGYNKILGRNDMEKISLIEIHVPRLNDGELNGTQTIPIFYLWKFAVADIQSPDDYAFVRGNLIRFRELEEYKVYEDDQYIVYELHKFVYSDLRTYVEEMLIQNDSIYFDDAIWARIQSFYNKYSDREYMESCFYLPENENRQRRPMSMDDVMALAETGMEISFEDLKPYSRMWKDIDDPNGYGLSMEIDCNYELYYSLHPDGTLNGYFLYHNPSGDKIDIRYEDVSAFVEAHGQPQPRCECEDTESGVHGWYLTLDWLEDMTEDCIISRFRNSCCTRVEDAQFSTYHYPVDDERFHVEVSWNAYISGESKPTDENVILVHNETGDQCNVRTEDVASFIASHN